MDKRFPYWSRADADKLHDMLISGAYSWEDLMDEFPDRTTGAIQCKARSMRVKNMFYVYLSRAAKYAGRANNKPQLPADVMVKPADGELYHANGRKVSYA